MDALFGSIRQGESDEAVRAAAAKVADVSAVVGGKTALLVAVSAGRPEAIATLVEFGAWVGVGVLGRRLTW